MPNSKSAKEEMRKAETRRMQNKPIRTYCKTAITKTEKLIVAGDVTSAEKEAVVAVSALDKAAERGVLHPNNAARRKSRLMQKLNSARPKA